MPASPYRMIANIRRAIEGENLGKPLASDYLTKLDKLEQGVGFQVRMEIAGSVPKDANRDVADAIYELHFYSMIFDEWDEQGAALRMEGVWDKLTDSTFWSGIEGIVSIAPEQPLTNVAAERIGDALHFTLQIGLVVESSS